MSDNGTEITSSVGRLVWGDPTKPRAKTDQQNNPVLKQDGTPVMQTSFGVAYPKAEFQQFIWPAMAAEAQKGYPQGFPPTFSWKFVDGDTVDKQGKPYSAREGYAGHMVLAVSTELTPPGIFKFENGAYRQMQPNEVNCGDYVRVGLNFKVNIPRDRTHTPGVYVNPLAIEHVGYGQPIQTGFQADPNALFGGQQATLPQGASATPVAAAAPAAMPGMGMGAPQPQGMPGQMPGAPMQQPQQQYAPQPQMPPMGQPPMQQPQMPPPAHDFVQNAGMAPAPQGMPQPQGMPGAAPFPGAMPPR